MAGVQSAHAPINREVTLRIMAERIQAERAAWQAECGGARPDKSTPKLGVWRVETRQIIVEPHVTAIRLRSAQPA